jgi:hypothetical protein
MRKSNSLTRRGAKPEKAPVRRPYSNVTWGLTYREALLIVTVLGLVFGLIMPQVLAFERNVIITRAVTDLDHFRYALKRYEKDYGSFPNRSHNCTMGICLDLKDPAGRPYIVLPNNGGFAEFNYEPADSGKSYKIEVAALDPRHTKIFANPKNIEIN